MKQLIIITLLITMSGCAATNVRQDQSTSELYMKAEAAYAQRDYANAKQYYLKVAEKYPDNVTVFFKLGNISMRENDLDKAMNYYTLVLGLKPNHARAHHNLAMLHLSKAGDHLNYYVAHNDLLNNKSIGKLIDAINDYSTKEPEQKSSLDRLADIVKHQDSIVK